MKKILFLIILSLFLDSYSNYPLENLSTLEKIERIAPLLVKIRSETVGIINHPNTNKPVFALLIRNGSGIILNNKGVIATAYHVVMDAQRIKVYLNDNRQFIGHLIKVSPNKDIALIKINLNNYDDISLKYKDKINLGEKVYIISKSPLLEDTISAGIVTGLGYNSYDQSLEAIKTDIELYEGDSGTPVFNQEGEILGMITLSEKKMSIHSSIAIPIEKVLKLYKNYFEERRKYSKNNQ